MGGTLDNGPEAVRDEAARLDAGGASPPREGHTEQEQQQMTDEGNNGLPSWVPYKTKPKKTACEAQPNAAFESLVVQVASGELDRVLRAIYQHKRKKALHEPPTAAEETFARMYRKLLRRVTQQALKAMREVEPGKRPPHYA